MSIENHKAWSDIRDFYDNEYYKNDANHSLPWHCRLVARRLGNMQGKQVLDVACGTGEWLEFFHANGAKIAGIDLSEKAIARCMRRFDDGEFHCGPAEHLPFEDARFDLVTCLGSLEHFIDKPVALAEMLRVAKPDARFLILVPNAGFLTRRIGFYRGTQQVKAREDVLELQAWERLFRDAGLQVLTRWRDLHPLSWSWIFSGRWFAWPIRFMQAIALATWPLRWQCQIYFYCRPVNAS